MIDVPSNTIIIGSTPVKKSENTAVGIRHADHVAPFIRKSWQSLRRQAAVAQSVCFARGLRPRSLFIIGWTASVV
jgi:hypothetical protein